MGDRPTGTVTFLFTDIEGSTQLWEDEEGAMAAALEVHDVLLSAVFDEHGGYVFSTGGDGFAVAFGRAQDALAAAGVAQDALRHESWGTSRPIRIRVGIHVGEVQERGGDYFGPAVNRAARLMSAGYGGQTLVSDPVAQIVGTASMTDLGVHRFKDLAAEQRVWQVGGDSFGSLRSLDVTKHNLPVQRTELMGRDAEIATLVGTVSHHRLLTITGIGGTGKTRLALAVASEVMASFDEGTFMVELATLSEDGAVGRAVAKALGIRADGSDETIASNVGALLSGRDLLLVLDNAEHVLDETAEFVDIVLEKGNRCAVLVTSREPLDVDGEQVHRISSVEPVAGASILAARALAAGARLDPAADAQPLEELSEQLDGIPLALELAAAHLVHLTPSDLLGRLNDRFALLVGGRRRRRQRQQTLSAVLDWSWAQLDDEQRSLLSQLSVFHGGWTLGAAESICRTRAPLTVSLRDLVRSNLVLADGSGRYGLLETIRLFAQDQLVNSGRAAETRTRHMNSFIELSSQTRNGISGPEEAHWIAVIDAETDNLVAAMTWALDNAYIDEALALAENLQREVQLRGRTEFRRPVTALAELLARTESEHSALGFALLPLFYVNADDPIWELSGTAMTVDPEGHYLIAFAQMWKLWQAGRVEEADPLVATMLETPERIPHGERGSHHAWAATFYAFTGRYRPDLITAATELSATEGAGNQALTHFLCGLAEVDHQRRRRRIRESLALAEQTRCAIPLDAARYHLAVLDAADANMPRRDALESVQRSLSHERNTADLDRANALHYIGRALALLDLHNWALFAWTAAENIGGPIIGVSRDTEQLAQLQEKVDKHLSEQQRNAIRADATSADVREVVKQLNVALERELHVTR